MVSKAIPTYNFIVSGGTDGINRLKDLYIFDTRGAFGVKRCSPEGGFAASYGDEYGLHSGVADKGPLYGMGSGSWGAFEKSQVGRRRNPLLFFFFILLFFVSQYVNFLYII